MNEILTPDRDDRLVYLAAGTLAPVLLGMVLVPLRELTTVANLTFPFLALTIVIAELGGRRAALAAALSSSLSMNFFLTRPYLRLTIDSKHDIIAFAGLTVCGLTAAALASSRGRSMATLDATRRQLGLLHASARRLEEGGPMGEAIEEILESVGSALPLRAAVVRNQDGEFIASSGSTSGLPDGITVLRSEALLSAGDAADATARGGLPLPTRGARVELRFGSHHVGWLELWGNGKPASAQARRTLSDVCRIVGALLGRGAGSSVTSA